MKLDEFIVYRQLEESIDKWTLELEDMEKKIRENPISEREI